MRYAKNERMLTPEENKKLRDFRVCVIGCGGLGGYIIELLGRMGIGYITVVDGDVFDETNLNRQLVSHQENLGKYKALEVKKRMALVNMDVTINAVCESLHHENAEDILKGHHLVMDALDNVVTRIHLQATAKKLNIPFVHGAISGWNGQVTTVFPGDDSLNLLYESVEEVQDDFGNPSFTPALIASYQVAEGLKILLNHGALLRMKVLLVDLYRNQVTIGNLTEKTK